MQPLVLERKRERERPQRMKLPMETFVLLLLLATAKQKMSRILMITVVELLEIHSDRLIACFKKSLRYENDLYAFGVGKNQIQNCSRKKRFIMLISRSQCYWAIKRKLHTKKSFKIGFTKAVVHPDQYEMKWVLEQILFIKQSVSNLEGHHQCFSTVKKINV